MKNGIFLLALLVGVFALVAGCEKKAVTATSADKAAFTGGSMPEDAKVKMREAQAKAMAKAGAGAAPQANPAAPK